MSNFTHKPNTGSLFKNERKEKENQPDYKGEIDINGTVLDLAAWVKESKSGKKFFSIKASEKNAFQGERKAGPTLPLGDDDDIPF